jgi:hypothetical protein
MFPLQLPCLSFPFSYAYYNMIQKLCVVVIFGRSLNGGNIKGNFKLDDIGQPMSTAQGNMPDLGKPPLAHFLF